VIYRLWQDFGTFFLGEGFWHISTSH